MQSGNIFGSFLDTKFHKNMVALDKHRALTNTVGGEYECIHNY